MFILFPFYGDLVLIYTNIYFVTDSRYLFIITNRANQYAKYYQT